MVCRAVLPCQDEQGSTLRPGRGSWFALILLLAGAEQASLLYAQGEAAGAVLLHGGRDGFHL